jgi:hypothetical protein
MIEATSKQELPSVIISISIGMERLWLQWPQIEGNLTFEHHMLLVLRKFIEKCIKNYSVRHKHIYKTYTLIIV